MNRLTSLLLIVVIAGLILSSLAVSCAGPTVERGNVDQRTKEGAVWQSPRI